MTPTAIGGVYQRLSRLSLALFEGTGWYTSVDYTKAWELYDGKGQGCNYANGTTLTYSAEPEACDTASTNNQCDLYDNYGGSCNANTGKVDL